jgi:hypothetical protein
VADSLLRSIPSQPAPSCSNALTWMVYIYCQTSCPTKPLWFLTKYGRPHLRQPEIHVCRRSRSLHDKAAKLRKLVLKRTVPRCFPDFGLSLSLFQDRQEAWAGSPGCCRASANYSIWQYSDSLTLACESVPFLCSKSKIYNMLRTCVVTCIIIPQVTRYDITCVRKSSTS